jgi:hemerythrin
VSRITDINGQTIVSPEHYHESLKEIGNMIDKMESNDVDRADMHLILNDLFCEAHFHLTFLKKRG